MPYTPPGKVSVSISDYGSPIRESLQDALRRADEEEPLTLRERFKQEEGDFEQTTFDLDG